MRDEGDEVGYNGVRRILGHNPSYSIYGSESLRPDALRSFYVPRGSLYIYTLVRPVSISAQDCPVSCPSVSVYVRTSFRLSVFDRIWLRLSVFDRLCF